VVPIAISFPTSLDVLTNPVASDATNAVSVPHATQHSNLNDAVEALEARVGITGSGVTSSLTYRIATVETTAATLDVDGWTSWTPVVTQSATPTLTNGGSTYVKQGRQVTATCKVTLTSAGTAANDIVCSLPVTAAAARGVGTFLYIDAGTGYIAGSCRLESTTTVKFYTVAASVFGQSTTIANTDTLEFTVVYESAA